MYTFRKNKALQNLFVVIYKSGKPSTAVCHSTTFLLETRLSNRALLVNGKTWTGKRLFILISRWSSGD